MKLDSNHIIGNKNCNSGECYYMTKSMITRNCIYCEDGTNHISKTDWFDYDFGSGKGTIWYEYVCDTCGSITRDDNIIKSNSHNLRLIRDNRINSGNSDEARLKAFIGFYNSLPQHLKDKFLDEINNDSNYQETNFKFLKRQ
jgi:hypothetical protein